LYLYRTEEEILNVNDFMSESIVDHLQNVVFTGSGDRIEDHKDGMAILLKHVTNEAFFKWFEFDEHDLKFICKSSFLNIYS
jgi:hypothetical protein